MGTYFIIDRRLNPKGKSLANRQRFIRRTKAQIRDSLKESVTDRKLTDSAGGETITIPSRGIAEPRFRHSRSGGYRERVLPGNKEFGVGDKIQKPQGGAGGAGGKEATDSGDGEDEFEFALTRDEFLDLFFEDLELPDLVKTSLKEVVTYKPERAGMSTVGTAANLNLLRTMRNSFARRIALKRPSSDAVEELEKRLFALENKAKATPRDHDEMKELRDLLAKMTRKRVVVPYIDPIDLRYNNFTQRPSPNTQAVMFCLMDVSGSMAQYEKDLAKRFFMLLHLFLERRYGKIDIVFIRHTHEAKEVDEETFFYSRETGGTIVSTALVEMREILKERYPPDEWNIYAAQASDGDNWSGDSAKCVDILRNELMPACQYYAYVEILDQREMDAFANEDNGAELWRAYRGVASDWPNFVTKRIAKPGDIYPVFRELFAKDVTAGAGATAGAAARENA
jgi:uncharacterized protein